MLEYGGSGGGSGYGAGAGRTGEARRVAAASTTASRNGLLGPLSLVCIFLSSCFLKILSIDFRSNNEIIFYIEALPP
jgi:hypothetical protein